MAQENISVHNIIEDIVIKEVNSICDAIEAGAASGSGISEAEEVCTCHDCRRGAVCYILNRIKPQYVVSGRGFTAGEQLSPENQQKIADIAVITYEALKTIKARERPEHGKKMAPLALSGVEFVIPIIIGRLFDGKNFEPCANIEVELRTGGKLEKMTDNLWPNPILINKNTEGAFTFSPAPRPARAEGEHTSFSYTLSAQIPGYEPLHHYFEVPVVSEIHAADDNASIKKTFKIPDLYIFPIETAG